jgi:hypothetical protein
MESMDHILIGCPYSRITWHDILSWIRSRMSIPSAEDRFEAWWQSTVLATPTALRRGTSSVIMLTAWWLWKRWNAVIFDGTQPDLCGLLDMIKAEASSWATAGASGLAAILPPA